VGQLLADVQCRNVDGWVQVTTSALYIYVYRVFRLCELLVILVLDMPY